MAEQRLKHVVFNIDSVLYFYDGELPVKEGVVTVPDGADVWAGAAWVQGYQIDADTGEPLSWTDVTERATRAVVAKSDKKGSAKSDEGSDAGRQPIQEDGLRTGEQPRADELPLEGDGSGDGDGAANGDAGSGTFGLADLDALR
jgi:hypothetical protein